MLKGISRLFIFSIFMFFACSGIAQTFTVIDGDTINYTDANGHKQGFWREFWPDGDLKYEVYYEDGQKDGLELYYYKNPDCIKESTNYKLGQLDGPTTKYFPDCSKKSEEYFKNGIKHGMDRTYHEKGWLMTDAFYQEGKLEGAVSHYDSKGSVKFESATKEYTINFDKFFSGEYRLKDSSLIKIMNRNDDWNDMLVVCDVTGSMFAYMGQLLIWYKLNFDLKKVKYFVLFNDGDKKDDNLKKSGATGGIYTYEATDFKSFKKSMEEVIRQGTGGDAPENDIEAILKGITVFKNYDEIILIADNTAGVRDIDLLKRLRKPVRIILCGTENGINPDFLKIAHKTKGSIHTIESDIRDIGNIQEGQTIDIDGNIFIFRAGNFQFVKYKK